MPDPTVTLVVVPRERFSYAKTSLESIYQYTQMPFHLVYVDGNSPQPVRRYLEGESLRQGFKLLRTNYYLYPNQARNLGAKGVDTDYIVFLDNDVVVSPGWLEALVDCAEATGAAVVGPLMCQHEPLHTEIHFAGGESHVWISKLGQRRLREKMYNQGKLVADYQAELVRTETELAEFHCVLVRRRILDQIGGLDETLLNTKEHLDFCMTVRAMGETVYFEPTSLVTYVPGPPQNWGDLHYYMLRWSNAWTRASLQRLREKWNLEEDSYFKTKYRKLDWRRRMTLVAPIVSKLTLGYKSPKLEKLIMWLENHLNRYLTDNHQRIQPVSDPTSSNIQHPSLVNEISSQ
jgi:GT2 family glycosyltransferase